MPIIVITRQDLEQLFGCQKRLPFIITSLQHTHGCGVNVPEELVNIWDKVKELCDLLCHHWYEALEAKEKSIKALNLLASSKVKRSVETLDSAITRENARLTATDDERHRLEWDAMPEDWRLESEQTHLWKKLMAYEEKYPKQSAVPPPGVEAYSALYKLLELTKEKGWITDNGPGTLMNESEVAKLDRVFREHTLKVKTNLMGHTSLLGHKNKAKIDQTINGVLDTS